VMVTLLTKLLDGGPVLFVQRRMGRGNQFFDMFKFRSMREERRDCQEFRVWAGIMGKKESHYVPTQRTCDPL
jgi:lipopolysaccharide/colanic/teichoic acid biosynthesis glycosyltransferase